MIDLREYIESGILELYVQGELDLRESVEVESLATAYSEIREEINDISEALEDYTRSFSLDPPAAIKPFLLASIDYSERIKNGEVPEFPPVLNEASTIVDFSKWISRKDMNLPDSFDGLYAKIIGYTPAIITAIVWIKDRAPEEVHDNEFEKFLIVEGSCTITIEDNIYTLFPGNYLSIPLHKNHKVDITSSIPCKLILQRVAA